MTSPSRPARIGRLAYLTFGVPLALAKYAGDWALVRQGSDQAWRRGEFRLIDLGGGRTRLEGSTWYEIDMAPEGYWQLWSDALIGRIHRRVLDHIKREAEREGVR